ncbi:hypothetical protein LTR85_002234 [Meristemomyces frigidus]|nr:hypothetical protein LTR85_002234 [Meristemomyces frigidus]
MYGTPQGPSNHGHPQTSFRRKDTVANDSITHVPALENLPLSASAREEAMNHYHDLQNTLRTKSADDANEERSALHHRAQTALQAMSTGLGKLHRQHQDCRSGADGTKHIGLGPCCVGTRWEPLPDDDPEETRELYSDRTGWQSDWQEVVKQDHDGRVRLLANKLLTTEHAHFAKLAVIEALSETGTAYVEAISTVCAIGEEFLDTAGAPIEPSASIGEEGGMDVDAVEPLPVMETWELRCLRQDAAIRALQQTVQVQGAAMERMKVAILAGKRR